MRLFAISTSQPQGLSLHYPFIAFILLFLGSLSLPFSLLDAQNVAAYQDQRGQFYYFDNGNITKLDHNPVEYYKLGDDFVIYRNSQDEMIYYRNGRKETLHLRPLEEDYVITGHLIYQNVGEVFRVIDHKQNMVLSLQDDPTMVYGDSIVAFVDYNGGLKVFYNGEKKSVHPIPPESFSASHNSFAFVDNRGWLYFYHDGETTQVTEDPPNMYQLGNDYVIFNDLYDEFKFWRAGEVTTLSDYPPTSLKLGDNIAAFVDDRDDFYIIKEGDNEATLISANAPPFFDIVHNTLVFIDEQGYLKVYDDGEIKTITPYRPQKFKYDKNVVAYVDHDGRLRAYYNGKDIAVSNDIVGNFELYGKVILFELGNMEYQIFFEGLLY